MNLKRTQSRKRDTRGRTNSKLFKTLLSIRKRFSFLREAFPGDSITKSSPSRLPPPSSVLVCFVLFFTALCILKLLLIFCFLAMYDVVSLPQYNVNAMRERNLSFSFTPVSPVPRTVPGPRRCSVNKCCLNKCPGISKKISQAINTLSS